MGHLVSLAIKTTAITIFSTIVLPSVGLQLWQAVVMGVATSIVLYILSDLIILPLWGNLAATAGDTLGAFFFLWYLWPADTTRSLLGLTVLAGVIGAFEWYFHNYLVSMAHPGLPLFDTDERGKK